MSMSENVPNKYAMAIGKAKARRLGVKAEEWGGDLSEMVKENDELSPARVLANSLLLESGQ